MKIRCEMNFPVLFGLIFVLNYGCGLRISEDGNCYIKFKSPDDWNQLIILDEIQDTETDKVIFDSAASNIKETTICQSNLDNENNTICPLAFIIDDKNQNIQITTNADLAKIDNGKRLNSNPRDVRIDVTFACASGSKELSIKIRVKDTDNHPPTFSKSSYEYTLPMPIPPSIDLMQFGTDVITVQDLDFSNQIIEFTSSSKELKCSTSITQGEFPYVLKLEFLKITRLPDAISFKIHATDSGGTVSSVDVKFNIDEKNSEPYVPVFTLPSFTYNYDASTGKITPSSTGGDVTLKEEAKNVFCEISGDYATYMDTPTVTGTKINLNLKTPFPKELLDELFLKTTISCYLKQSSDSKGYADVIISLPKPEKTSSFSRIMYNAEYLIENAEHTVQMKDYIEIEGSLEKVIIKVEDAYKTFFDVKDTGENKWSLTKLKNLDSTLLQSTSLEVTIGLIANDEQIDEAVIMLLLPNGETGINFIMPMFTGSYTIDKSGTASLTLESDIQLNSEYLKIVTFSLEGKYQKYFSVAYDEKSKIFDLNISQDLPKKVVEEGSLSLILKVVVGLGSLQQTAKTSILLQFHDDSTTTTTPGTTTSTTSGTTTSTTSGTTTSTTSGTTTSTTPGTTTGHQSTSTSTEKPTTKKPDDDTCDCDETAWIVVTIVLCIVLLLYVAATILYYFMKLRKKQTGRFSSDEPTVQPHFQKKESYDSRPISVSTRRPTGFIRFNPDLDRDSQISDEELRNNTLANKSTEIPTEPLRKISSGAKNMAFQQADSRPAPEPLTLDEELKKAVQQRGNLY